MLTPSHPSLDLDSARATNTGFMRVHILDKEIGPHFFSSLIVG